MPDDVDGLIKEIAVKHGIAVSRDDPIVILQTLNNRLIQDSGAAQLALLDSYKEEMEALALRWGLDATDKAERIVNASLLAGKEAMFGIMRESAQATATAMRAEIDSTLGLIASNLLATRTLAILNVVASCLTMLAAAVALWVILR
jgi:multidrug efflux pump subunit AcrA (membrane-fusion protein)